MEKRRQKLITRPGGGRSKDGRPPVILAGLDEMIGLQMARTFARRGIEVIGIAKRPDQYGCATRYVKRQIVANTYGDEVIPALVELGKSLERKAVLIPCIDETVLRVSRNRALLDPYFMYALPEPDVVEMLTDKATFFRFARKENLPIPKTFLISSKDEARAAASDIRYPCILKPALKTPKWWSTFFQKALMMKDAREFMSAYEKMEPFIELLIAQEWIRGGEGALYSSNCYYDKNGKPLVTFIARKIRQWPPMTGVASLSEECRDDTVLALSNLIFCKVPYHGFGYLEVKKDEATGEYLMIETNIARPTGRSSLAEGCGVELHYTMYCDVVGLPLPENRVQTYRGGKWIQLVNDIRSARYFWSRGELTIAEYLRSLRGIKVFAIWSLSDPVPFFVDLWLKFTNTIQMKFHRDTTRRPQLP